MSFALKITEEDEPKEYVEELITTEHTTSRMWSKEQIAKEVAKLEIEIQTRQDRIIVLVAQVDKFTKEITK